jgi:hypothetical protein
MATGDRMRQLREIIPGGCLTHDKLVMHSRAKAATGVPVSG